MAQGKLLAICQYGGEFVTGSDGSMSYIGGEAHAIDVDRDMSLDEFKSEIANMFTCKHTNFSIKYYLPSNKRTLITVSNDKDLQRMVDFNAKSTTTDVYILDNKVEKRTRRSIVAVSTTPTLVPVDATTTMLEARQERICDAWDNAITGVGQVFDSTKAFRDALHKYAIAKGFMYKFIKNEGLRVTAECTAEDCGWRIHASGKEKVAIKKMNDVHTCGGLVGKESHRLANQRWVASVIKDKLRDSPDYKPREIAEDLHREYGLYLNYSQAYRGKYLAKQELYDPRYEARSQLPAFCERIMETNPGSIATFTPTDDSGYHRLFVSFHASLHGFEHGCRPLLFLDGISLESNRYWKVLAATAVDGENAMFPVAFTVVETDNKVNWQWFLGKLKSALSMSRSITFVSNRQNGLDEAVSEVFEDSYHGYCLSHLIEDFKEELEDSWTEEVKDGLLSDLKHAADAYKVDEFNACIESIRNVSKEVAEWVLASKPEYWSNAFFKGLRYNSMSSSVAESFNTWVTKVSTNEPSVVQMVDMIRCMIMEMIYTRRAASNAWVETLVPSMNQKLVEESIKARALDVMVSTASVFEVRDPLNDSSVDVVNIETWECTCRRWQVTGLPCIHAIAALESGGDGCVYNYCSKYFTTESYRLTYSMSINPIPDDGKTGSYYRLHRGPGRPKQKLFESPKMSKRPLQCSRCKLVGHNKLTCKADI